jgi:hypothetical protein
LGLGDLLDFRENEGGFVLERIPHCFVIAFRIFPSPVFELQVAQIVVDGIAPLKELVEFCPVRGKIGRIRLNVENEQEDGCRQAKTSAGDGPFGWRGDKDGE